MNTEITNILGNRVFLIAAIFNMLLTMSYGELAEYALYALVGNSIGALIWFLFKILADRLGIGTKGKRIISKIPKRKGLDHD